MKTIDVPVNVVVVLLLTSKVMIILDIEQLLRKSEQGSEPAQE